MQSSVRLFRAAFGLTMANVIVMVVNALIGIFTARMLSPYEYGHVAYFMSMYLMAMLIAGFGLTDQIMRDVAHCKSLDQSTQLGQVFYSLLLSRLITSMGLILVLGVYAFYLHQWTPLLIGLAAALTMVFDFFTGVLRGVQRVGALIGLLCMQPLLYLGLILVVQPASADQVFVLFCTSFSVVAVVASLALYGCGLGWPRRSSLSRAYLRTSSGGAAQLYTVALLQLAYSSIGTLLLGAVGAYEAAGVASVGLTIVRMLPLMLGSTITSVYYPQLRANLAQGATQAATQAFQLFYQTTLWIALGGAALLLVFPDAAVHTLYTAKYDVAVPVVQLLAPLCVLLIIDLFLTWTLIAHEHMTIAITTLALRLGMFGIGSLVMLLIDAVDMTYGIAIVYLCSSLAGAMLQVRAVARLGVYPFALPRSVIVGGGAIVIALACRWLLPDLPIHTISYVGNSVCAVVLYSFLIGALSYRSIAVLVVPSALRLRSPRIRP